MIIVNDSGANPLSAITCTNKTKLGLKDLGMCSVNGSFSGARIDVLIVFGMKNTANFQHERIH